MSAVPSGSIIGSIIREMSDHELVEYREKLIAEIEAKSTVARPMKWAEFMTQYEKEKCQALLNEVNDEGMKRFIVIHNQDPEE